jgi:hypothetical protein
MVVRGRAPLFLAACALAGTYLLVSRTAVLRGSFQGNELLESQRWGTWRVLASPQEAPLLLEKPSTPLAGTEDAVNEAVQESSLALHRIDRAYAELSARHEQLLREEEAFNAVRTGTEEQRRVRWEELGAAQRQVDAYALALASEKRSIEEKLQYMRPAGRYPSAARVVPPAAEGVVQMSRDVHRSRSSPVSNLHYDDGYDASSDEKSIVAVHASTADAIEDADVILRRAQDAQTKVGAVGAVGAVDEEQALKGAMGEEKLSASELRMGGQVLRRIRNLFNAAAVLKAKNGSAASGAKSKKAHKAHHQHRTGASAPPTAAKKSAANSIFTSTVHVSAREAEGASKHGEQTRRRARLHVGAEARADSARSIASKVQHSAARGQQGMRVVKALQLKASTHPVPPAREPHDTSDTGTQVRKDAKNDVPANKAHKARASAAAADAAAEGIHSRWRMRGAGKEVAARDAVKAVDKPKFDLRFDGFGMHIRANVQALRQTWQPGAAAWYAYAPGTDQMRREGLEEEADLQSGARVANGGPQWVVLATSILVCLAFGFGA